MKLRKKNYSTLEPIDAAQQMKKCWNHIDYTLLDSESPAMKDSYPWVIRREDISEQIKYRAPHIKASSLMPTAYQPRNQRMDLTQNSSVFN